MLVGLSALLMQFLELWFFCYPPDVIARHKISILDAHRERIRQKYKDHMLNYVTSLLGRPLEKLSVSSSFFEYTIVPFTSWVGSILSCDCLLPRSLNFNWLDRHCTQKCGLLHMAADFSEPRQRPHDMQYVLGHAHPHRSRYSQLVGVLVLWVVMFIGSGSLVLVAIC